MRAVAHGAKVHVATVLALVRARQAVADHRLLSAVVIGKTVAVLRRQVRNVCVSGVLVLILVLVHVVVFIFKVVGKALYLRCTIVILTALDDGIVISRN